MSKCFTLLKILAPLPEPKRGKPFVLKAHPKEEKFLFTVANSIVVRDCNDPFKSEIVTIHSKRATCACYAPSGFYIASGDESGTLKIWDTVNEEHMVKYEYHPLSASVNDIAWSEDSKRVLAVGDGRGKYGSVFSWDTGTSVGEAGGHVKCVLSGDFKQVRPYSIITCGEDMNVVHSNGPPFKYVKTISNHKNFVNCIRYSRDGKFAASCSSDGKIFIYDGGTMENKKELVCGDKNAHSGGVYAVSWSPDSQKLLSASADKSCKIWNVESGEVETTFIMGKDVSDQQYGCLWIGEHLISLSLSGKLTFLNPADPVNPHKVYWGHNKGIICMNMTEDKKYIYSGSYDGTLNRWDTQTGECTLVSGVGMSTQITDITIYGNSLSVVGVGDTVRFVSISENKYFEKSAKIPSQSTVIVARDENTVLVGCEKEVSVIVDQVVASTFKTNFGVTAISFRKNSNIVVIGSSNNSVYFYELNGSELKEMTGVNPIKMRHPVSRIVHSHSGDQFAVATCSKTVAVYCSNTFRQAMEWNGHENRVTWIEWSEDDRYIASCGVDGSINIWKVDELFYRIEIPGAHRTYMCTRVRWLDDKTLVSAGQQDCTLKFWSVQI